MKATLGFLQAMQNSDMDLTKEQVCILFFFSSAETFARSSTGNKCMGLGSGQGLYFENTARPRDALFLVPEKIRAA